MNVFILEDDVVQQQQLERKIKELLIKNNIKYKRLFATAKPERLLEEMDSVANHQIYFLDLEINDNPQMGLEVSLKIREKDRYGSIVFVTTQSQLLRKTLEHQIGVVDFIEKDQDVVIFEKRIERSLIRANAYKRIPVNNDTFFFENQYTSFQIPFSDILFFETSGISHRINLVTAEKILDFRGTLREIEMSDNRLFQCHKTCVVNIANIRSVDKKERLILFDNGISCEVGRRLVKETINKMKEIKNRYQ